ncbi:hypothetical protein TBLA_0C03130 [Henningerozyma blattae CBS 6284]|uniref:ATP-dependent DNA helicase RRM3 n=1 Tax=Henningerozyma blattae (strain ATCC 34711 / CBS 6284 / DSM 70876 / NBRC 10599 / NRRL Y-10934 / UCD 77-7) TaxID=1071380 RepID=I2H165_HENB6|nr:hypothetical protein TBLA_0C03130 [Tetrapisispora blattae CBS 6284]CCH60117.1 hypothetical protein TBLA_0C03130 [Tetrapisispora blattae CBS 6284]
MFKVSKKKPEKKQRSIASFFSSKKTFTPPKDDAPTTKIATENATTHTDATIDLTTTTAKTTISTSGIPSSISLKRQVVPPNRSIKLASRTSSNQGSSLFSSQGSFDETDPSSELQSLLQKPKLASFKPIRRSLKAGPSSKSLVSTSSSTITSTSSSIHSSSGKRHLSSTNHLSSTSNTPSLSSTFPNISLSINKKLKSSPRKLTASSSSNKHNSDSYYEIKLSKQQQDVVNCVIKKRQNVFYTGAAGTGKSIILRTIISKLHGLYGKDAIAVTASTGLAANNIGGCTLHKWAGIGLGKATAEKCIQSLSKKYDTLALWRRTRVLIIDEVSMIDGDFLDKLDVIAQHLRNSKQPFGGIQLVLTGDFFQLPPVNKNRAENSKTAFCFQSRMWKNCIERTILLTEVFRQRDDDELVSILNSIRLGEINPKMSSVLKSLERNIAYPDGISPTELYPTRREVDLSNSRQLNQLPGKLYTYKSSDLVQSHMKDMLNASVLAEENVYLKDNAQVMMLKNKPESELVNGSLGKVLFFSTERLIKKMIELYGFYFDDEIVNDMRLVSNCIENPSFVNSDVYANGFKNRPIIRHEKLSILTNFAVKTNTKLEKIYPYVRWTIGPNKYHNELMMDEIFPVDVPGDNIGMQRTQIPVMLCYALSIHKAQGQTIQRLKVDLKNIFEAGQVYVALSRAVSKDSLQILNFNPKKIKADEEVKKFYHKLEKLD